jgi:hypothetical protein
MSRASQAVENSASQAKQLVAELVLPEAHSRSRLDRLNSLRQKTSWVVNAIGSVEVDKLLGLHWVTSVPFAGTSGSVQHLEMRDQKNNLIMEAETVADEVALQWETEESVLGFSRAVEWLSGALALAGPVSISVRLPGKPGVKMKTVKTASAILQGVADLVEGGRLSLVTIDLGAYRFWYKPYPEPQMGSIGKPPRPARIAVRFREEKQVKFVSEFFGRTASEWVFPQAVEKFLRSVLAGDLRNSEHTGREN